MKMENINKLAMRRDKFIKIVDSLREIINDMESSVQKNKCIDGNNRRHVEHLEGAIRFHKKLMFDLNGWIEGMSNKIDKGTGIDGDAGSVKIFH